MFSSFFLKRERFVLAYQNLLETLLEEFLEKKSHYGLITTNEYEINEKREITILVPSLLAEISGFWPLTLGPSPQ